MPLRDIVRIQCTSGTTGRPVVVGYTPNDVRTWSECVARVLAAGGVTEHDVVQVAYTYGLFSGGLGFHYGAERVGASVVPASTGSLERQVMIMRDFKTSALACTPGLRAGARGCPRRRRHRPGSLSPARGILRRRAVERGAARAARVAPRHPRDGHLRPHRGARARGRLRVRGAPRPARERGPLHRRGDRPGDARGEAARARRESWSSPRSPRKVSRWCATAPAT